MTTVNSFISSQELGPSERRVANYLKALSEDLADTTLLQRPMALFMDGDKPLSSIREINKIYFSLPKETPIISEQMESIISDYRIVAEEKTRSGLATIHRNIRDYQDRVTRELRRLKDISVADESSINSLRDSLSRFRPGFWELVDISCYDISHLCPLSRSLGFKTLPIVLEHGGKQVLFGRMTFALCHQSGSTYLSPVRDHSENIILHDNTDCIHPFVVMGNVCYGEQSPLESKLSAANDVTGLLELTRLLLTTYDPNSTPYRSLGEFYLKATRPDGSCPWRSPVVGPPKAQEVPF